MTANERPQIVPVLVVGAGPAGLTTAIGLARHGVRSMLVERHPGTSTFPKASGISTRTMEIFRSWGLEEAMREHSQDVQPSMSAPPDAHGPAARPAAASAFPATSRRSPSARLARH